MPSETEFTFMAQIRGRPKPEPPLRPLARPVVVLPDSPLRRAVKDDTGQIHTVPFDDPQYPDESHAGIMLRAQHKGATFDTYTVEHHRGYVDAAGGWVSGDDGDSLLRQRQP